MAYFKVISAFKLFTYTKKVVQCLHRVIADIVTCNHSVTRFPFIVRKPFCVIRCAGKDLSKLQVV